VFLHGFDRPNIHLAFAAKDNPRDQILRFAAARRAQSGIVYCASRAKTETLARALGDAGHSTCFYHGGMEAEARRSVEMRFQQEDGLIVVATIAFGMGIDNPDIRWVAHADLPKSIESYYQEIGRAGRDGAPAETLTLYGPEDIKLRRTQIDEGIAPADRKAADHLRLNSLLGLAEAISCRRQILLGYFGEPATPCGNCDICDVPADVFNATDAVRKVFLTVKNNDKPRAVAVARDLVAMGFELVATKGTAQAISAAGLAVVAVNKVTEGRPHVVDMIKNNEIAVVINTVEERRNAIADSRQIRTSALLARVTTFTTIAVRREIQSFPIFTDSRVTIVKTIIDTETQHLFFTPFRTIHFGHVQLT
jgi:RecQ family ATP-dependent DNA helicase